jgi:hypothetical protein
MALADVLEEQGVKYRMKIAERKRKWRGFSGEEKGGL